MKSAKLKFTITAFFSLFFAGLIFLNFYGYEILNLFYTDWIKYHSGDILQHYLGWLFYSKAPFEYPYMLFDSLTYPQKISPMYTDSIPLVAIFVKIIVKIFNITREVQYFGLFVFCNFLLQGFFGLLISKKILKNNFLAILGSVLFVILPVFLQAGFRFPALYSHWILLATFSYIFYFSELSNKKKYLFCSLLALISSGIHFYLAAMSGMIIFLFSFFNYFLNKNVEKKEFLILPLIYFLTSATVVFLLGGFSSGIAYFAYCYDHPNLNPLAIFQNKYSGWGLLFLIIASMFAFKNIKKRDLNKELLLFLVFIALLFYFIAIVSDNSILIRLPFFKLFRFNERFIFVLIYLMLIGSISLITCYKNVILKYILFVAALVLQYFCIQNNFEYKFLFFKNISKQSSFFEENINKINVDFDKKNNLIIPVLSYSTMPYDFASKNNKIDHELLFIITYWAYKQNYKLTQFFLARFPLANGEYMLDKINKPQKNDIFIFKKTDKDNIEKMNCQNVQYITLYSRVTRQDVDFIFCRSN